MYFRLFEESELNNGFGLSFEGGREFCKTKGGDLVTWGEFEEESNFETVRFSLFIVRFMIKLSDQVLLGS